MSAALKRRVEYTDAEILECAAGWRRRLWRMYPNDEIARLTELEAICVRLCEGDNTKGANLAQKAIYL